ncbi:endolytic transglycosylase MltG [Herbiconiux sp. CPCC 203407]|uniref:Endolytic murein transglycosylase n=1 Tax=Herbiconiux oxytropis TaxID=2970915 RepID=A0AA42BV34_9MICO|nr:endolytic transglycosylase MltG [Herbiconiux oxytropis]MCS5720431.1 endolytic transglycosylase MltG [Herbiconiux oxytropis]MCS5726004.1 endolytic transglycosylase MltG [Herbiconiux oxytropis]
MTDRQPPEDHPFAEFFREPERPQNVPRSRRDARMSEAARAPQAASGGRRGGRVGGGGAGGGREKKPRRWVGGLIFTVVAVGLLVGGGVFVWNTFGSQIQTALAGNEVEDYQGTGTGEVMFVINSGDVGEVIGDNLESAGVVKSSSAFYQELVSTTPEPVFNPGTFRLAEQMSARSALDALLDPANKVDNTVTIPEGSSAAGIYQELADVTGLPIEQFQAVGANYAALGVPAEAPSIEGFLFPATYTFEPGDTPETMITTMVNRTFQSLDAAGVPAEDRLRVLSFAALIQKEAGSVEDMAKVARVFQNRLDAGWNMESDATIAYGAGHSRVETTQAEREDPANIYNTYLYPGLPAGPIANPGDDAINAALNPADGPWFFFVTVDLDTGETVFSETVDQHAAAVERLQAWWAAHPEIE